jgi:hypothetical protein
MPSNSKFKSICGHPPAKQLLRRRPISLIADIEVSKRGHTLERMVLFLEIEEYRDRETRDWVGDGKRNRGRC